MNNNLDLDDIEVSLDLDSIELPELPELISSDMDSADNDSLDVDDLFAENADDVLDILSLDDIESSDLPAVSYTRSDVAVRREIPVSNTVEIYCTKLVNLLDHYKSSQLSVQHSQVELMKRLTAFYNSHNTNIVPVVEFGETKYGSTPSQIIMNAICARKPVSDILDILRDCFEAQRIYTSNMKFFKFTGVIKAKITEFIITVKNFYESELAIYHLHTAPNSNSSLNELTQYVSTTSEFFSHEDEISYPSQIDLGDNTFVCGNCADKSSLNYPFMRSIITNTDSSEWFFTILPTVECCSVCGTPNVLSANHFEKVARLLKEKFNGDVIDDLRVRLRELCDKYKVQCYDIAPETIMSVLTPDLFGLFVLSDNTNIITLEEDNVRLEFDLRASIDNYKETVRSLSPVLSKSSEDIPLYSEDMQLSDEVLNNFRGKFTKLLCAVVGTDYITMKEKAINSLIYFIEDTVPYVSNPYSMVSLTSDYMLDQLDEETYLVALDQFAKVKSNFQKHRDFFTFVPILHTISTHSKFDYYSADPEIRDFFDYCSDNMILFSIRADILKLGSLEKDLAPLLNKPNNVSSTLKKLQTTIVTSDYIMSMGLLVRNFIYSNYRDIIGLDYSNIFRYMSNKDIYNLVKCVDKVPVSFDPNSSQVFLPGLEYLRKELEQFRSSVNSQNRAEFNYQDLFPNVDLSGYDISSIEIPVRPPVGDLSPDEYFKVIRSKAVARSKKNFLKYSEWFDDNANIYFDLMCKYLLKDVSSRDVLFMDFLKSLACNDFIDVLKFLKIAPEIANVLLAGCDDFIFQSINADEELAKLLVINYPYVDDDIRLLISSADDSNIFDILMTEQDQIIAELKDASEPIRELIEKHLGFALSEVE